jgi:hypothetical protein
MKHKPKTPLPWKYVPAVRNNAPNYYAVGSGKWGEPVAAMCDDGNDAAYVTHAANAYPKLVKLLTALRNADDPIVRAICRGDATTLLRELGEHV